MAFRSFKARYARSLRARLIAVYAAGMLLTAVVLIVVMELAFAWQVDARTRHGLEELAGKVAGRLSFDAGGRPAAFVLPEDLRWVYDAVPGDIEFRVVDADGATVAGSPRPGRPLLPPDLRLIPAATAEIIQIDGKPVHVVSVPLRRAGAPYYVQAACSERLASLVWRTVWGPTKLGYLLTVLISMPVLIGLMLLTVRKLLRPLDEASAAAARIGPRNLAARLPAEAVPNEVLPLVGALNLALDRLETGYRAQQEFLAAAAHELKTPLALLRGQIEMEGPADRATLLNDIDVMARQVHQLLHLAEVSETQNYSMRSIAVAGVAADVVHFLSRLAERNAIGLSLRISSAPAAWMADKSALFTLLKNLVENAIQHSPAGAIVIVAIDAAGLSVKDDGAGIAPEDMPHLFKRFWRGPQARGGGAGLGLAICNEIAAAHGWHLCAMSVSRGAHFRLDIGAPA
jgi:signal transduction histidine kinase